MHPTFKQTPPRLGHRSIKAVFIPRSAARNAAVYPPGPEPRTTTSKSYEEAVSGWRLAVSSEEDTSLLTPAPEEVDGGEVAAADRGDGAPALPGSRTSVSVNDVSSPTCGF